MILWFNYNVMEVAAVLMFDLAYISVTTNEFLPGDNKDLLNWIEIEWTQHGPAQVQRDNSPDNSARLATAFLRSSSISSAYTGWNSLVCLVLASMDFPFLQFFFVFLLLFFNSMAILCLSVLGRYTPLSGDLHWLKPLTLAIRWYVRAFRAAILVQHDGTLQPTRIKICMMEKKLYLKMA